MPKPIVFLLFLTICLKVNLLFAQQDPPDYSACPKIQSPNASELGKYGEIPVSLFNGDLSLSIPIFEINTRAKILPISLSYESGGNRPDVHPGWTGLSWTLLTTGVIKRHANGTLDEYLNNLSSTKAYLSNYAILANANWASPSYYNDPNRKNIDLAPDEFSFSFGNLSGFFMLNHEGKWIVKSDSDPNIRVESEVQNNYTLYNLKGGGNMVLPSVFTKFTLTISDGTKYIFGREQSAIEFSMPALKGVQEPYNASGPQGPGTQIRYCPYTASDVNCGEVVKNVSSTAWFLSEIISPNNDHVNFDYESKISLQQNKYSNISKNQWMGQRMYKSYDVNQVSRYLIVSSYLKKIRSDDGTECDFYKSSSNELQWVPQTKQYGGEGFGFYGYGQDWEYFKLDSVVLKYKDKRIQMAKFEYIENTGERLKLRRLVFPKINAQEEIKSYSFNYNNKMLPPYNSGLEDHWGFYNNKNFWNGVQSQSTSTVVPNLDDYYNSRNPDPLYMDAEMLTRINFPTGGYSNFYFEPHIYSKQLNQNPSLVLEELGQNLTAGGLRIRKIENFENVSSSPQIKEYFYMSNYRVGGQLSSGILSGKPYYYNYITSNLYGNWSESFSSSSMNYLNTTNGNHITYSEVIERTQEGYTVLQFSNHDNGYMDKPAFAISSEDRSSTFAFKVFGKLDLERGKKLSEEIVELDGFVKRKVSNTYNDDPNRYSEYVRSMAFGSVSGNRVLYPIYTFKTFLKSSEMTEYFRNGTSNISRQEFTYDGITRLLKSKLSYGSDGRVHKDSYTYVHEYPINPYVSSSRQLVYREMAAKNMLMIPLEKVSSLIANGTEKTIGSSLNIFEKDYNTGLINLKENYNLNVAVPIADFQSVSMQQDYWDSGATSYWFEQLLKDWRYELEFSINRRNSFGNPLEITNKNGIVVSYIYSYNSKFPIIELKNASHATLENILGASYLSNLSASDPTSDDIAVLTQTLRNSPLLKLAEVKGFSYSPLIGMTSMIDPKGMTTYYEYDAFGRLQYVKDQNGNILKGNTYHYKN